MRVGLLVCDHVLSEFRHLSGDYPEMFAALFADHPQVELVSYDLPAGEFPTSPGECDAWITTGSRRSVYDAGDWIEQLADFVRRLHAADSPYFGVCFGHQMLAQALGGKVERSDRGWGVGVKEVEVVDSPDWLGPGPVPVLNSHADQIVEIPPGARILGRNDHCPVSMMAVGETMVGIQGHPEFTVGYAAALLRHRRGNLIPEETVDAALDTLADPPDPVLLADAIVRFLESSVARHSRR